MINNIGNAKPVVKRQEAAGSGREARLYGDMSIMNKVRKKMKKSANEKYLQLQKKNTSEEGKTRRSFLKKAVYAAPTLFVLGSLAKPTESEAGFGRPPSGPTWN